MNASRPVICAVAPGEPRARDEIRAENVRVETIGPRDRTELTTGWRHEGSAFVLAEVLDHHLIVRR